MLENRGVAEQWADRFVLWLAQHWLAALLTLLLFFAFAPFAAPVAMHLGWSNLGKTIYNFYIPFCHQLPQRSWFLFGEKLTYTLAEINQVYPHTDGWSLRFFYGTPELGWKVAWSDRMISFYTMTPVFGLIYALLRRGQTRPFRPIPLWLILVTLAPEVLDGFTHLISDTLAGDFTTGFRTTNAWLAVLTSNAWPTFYAGDHLGTFNWWARLITGLLAAWSIAFALLPFLDGLINEETEHSATTP